MNHPHLTADGSHTLRDERTGEHYHSTHGAERESRHVFIESGLELLHAQSEQRPLRILEVGFGTGLNALLSWQFALERQRPLIYLGLEPYPINPELYRQLYFPAMGRAGPEQSDSTNEVVKNKFWHDALLLLHGQQPEHLPTSLKSTVSQNVKHQAGLNTEPPAKDQRVIAAGTQEFFSFQIVKQALQDTSLAKDSIDLVYFDAFSPSAEPTLWQNDIWQLLYKAMNPGAVLVTYCAKGAVRRAMADAGFQVERLPGPPFKRHMSRAHKPRHKAT